MVEATELLTNKDFGDVTANWRHKLLRSDLGSCGVNHEVHDLMVSSHNHYIHSKTTQRLIADMTYFIHIQFKQLSSQVDAVLTRQTIKNEIL